jgi:hypothetical protein
MYQSWRMFRKPGTYNRFLIHEGLTADGEVVQIQRDTRPPEGRFVVLDYGRWRKVQYTLSVDDKYLDGYADWVCRQAPDDVESIRLRVYKYKKHTPKTARTGKARKEKDAVLLERPCP